MLTEIVRYQAAFSDLVECTKYPLDSEAAFSIFNAFMSHVVQWWASHLPALHIRHTYWQNTIIEWLQGSAMGGESPFRGAGSYSSEELLYLAGTDSYGSLFYPYVVQSQYRDTSRCTGSRGLQKSFSHVSLGGGILYVCTRNQL
jgi:hypothetical protein